MKRRRGAGLVRETVANRLSRQPGFALMAMADHPHTIDRWDDATGEKSGPKFISPASRLLRPARQVWWSGLCKSVHPQSAW